MADLMIGGMDPLQMATGPKPKSWDEIVADAQAKGIDTNDPDFQSLREELDRGPLKMAEPAPESGGFVPDPADKPLTAGEFDPTAPGGTFAPADQGGGVEFGKAFSSGFRHSNLGKLSQLAGKWGAGGQYEGPNEPPPEDNWQPSNLPEQVVAGAGGLAGSPLVALSSLSKNPVIQGVGFGIEDAIGAALDKKGALDIAKAGAKGFATGATFGAASKYVSPRIPQGVTLPGRVASELGRLGTEAAAGTVAGSTVEETGKIGTPQAAPDFGAAVSRVGRNVVRETPTNVGLMAGIHGIKEGPQLTREMIKISRLRRRLANAQTDVPPEVADAAEASGATGTTTDPPPPGAGPDATAAQPPPTPVPSKDLVTLIYKGKPYPNIPREQAMGVVAAKGGDAFIQETGTGGATPAPGAAPGTGTGPVPPAWKDATVTKPGKAGTIETVTPAAAGEVTIAMPQGAGKPARLVRVSREAADGILASGVGAMEIPEMTPPARTDTAGPMTGAMEPGAVTGGAPDPEYVTDGVQRAESGEWPFDDETGQLDWRYAHAVYDLEPRAAQRLAEAVHSQADLTKLTELEGGGNAPTPEPTPEATGAPAPDQPFELTRGQPPPETPEGVWGLDEALPKAARTMGAEPAAEPAPAPEVPPMAHPAVGSPEAAPILGEPEPPPPSFGKNDVELGSFYGALNKTFQSLMRGIKRFITGPQYAQERVETDPGRISRKALFDEFLDEYFQARQSGYPMGDESINTFWQRYLQENGDRLGPSERDTDYPSRESQLAEEGPSQGLTRGDLMEEFLRRYPQDASSFVGFEGGPERDEAEARWREYLQTNEHRLDPSEQDAVDPEQEAADFGLEQSPQQPPAEWQSRLDMLKAFHEKRNDEIDRLGAGSVAPYADDWLHFQQENAHRLDPSQQFIDPERQTALLRDMRNSQAAIEAIYTSMAGVADKMPPRQRDLVRQILQLFDQMVSRLENVDQWTNQDIERVDSIQNNADEAIGYFLNWMSKQRGGGGTNLGSFWGTLQSKLEKLLAGRKAREAQGQFGESLDKLAPLLQPPAGGAPTPETPPAAGAPPPRPYVRPTPAAEPPPVASTDMTARLTEAMGTVQRARQRGLPEPVMREIEENLEAAVTGYKELTEQPITPEQQPQRMAIIDEALHLVEDLSEPGLPEPAQKLLMGTTLGVHFPRDPEAGSNPELQSIVDRYPRRLGLFHGSDGDVIYVRGMLQTPKNDMTIPTLRRLDAEGRLHEVGDLFELPTGDRPVPTAKRERVGEVNIPAAPSPVEAAPTKVKRPFEGRTAYQVLQSMKGREIHFLSPEGNVRQGRLGLRLSKNGELQVYAPGDRQAHTASGKTLYTVVQPRDVLGEVGEKGSGPVIEGGPELRRGFPKRMHEAHAEGRPSGLPPVPRDAEGRMIPEPRIERPTGGKTIEGRGRTQAIIARARGKAQRAGTVETTGTEPQVEHPESRQTPVPGGWELHSGRQLSGTETEQPFHTRRIPQDQWEFRAGDVVTVKGKDWIVTDHKAKSLDLMDADTEATSQALIAHVERVQRPGGAESAEFTPEAKERTTGALQRLAERELGPEPDVPGEPPPRRTRAGVVELDSAITAPGRSAGAGAPPSKAGGRQPSGPPPVDVGAKGLTPAQLAGMKERFPLGARIEWGEVGGIKVTEKGQSAGIEPAAAKGWKAERRAELEKQGFIKNVPGDIERGTVIGYRMDPEGNPSPVVVLDSGVHKGIARRVRPRLVGERQVGVQPKNITGLGGKSTVERQPSRLTPEELAAKKRQQARETPPDARSQQQPHPNVPGPEAQRVAYKDARRAAAELKGQWVQGRRKGGQAFHGYVSGKSTDQFLELWDAKEVKEQRRPAWVKPEWIDYRLPRGRRPEPAPSAESGAPPPKVIQSGGPRTVRGIVKQGLEGMRKRAGTVETTPPPETEWPAGYTKEPPRPPKGRR